MDRFWEFFKPDTVQYYILVIVSGFLLYRIAKRIISAIKRIIGRRLDKKALYWLYLEKTIDFILLFVFLFGVISRLSFLGNLSNSLVAGSAVLVAAVGLAAQESIANVISGMFLSLFKPFAAGDRIKLKASGISGWIEDIGLRHSVIRTVENNRVIVPNSVMNKEIVENSDFDDERILNFLDVKITYDTDFERAIDIMLDETIKHPGFVDWRNETQKKDGEPVTRVLVRDIANHCVELRVGVWAKDINTSFNVCSDIRLGILRRYKDEGVILF